MPHCDQGISTSKELTEEVDKAKGCSVNKSTSDILAASTALAGQTTTVLLPGGGSAKRVHRV